MTLKNLYYLAIAIIVSIIYIVWASRIKTYNEKMIISSITSVMKNNVVPKENKEGIDFDINGMLRIKGEKDYKQTYTLFSHYGRIFISEERYTQIISNNINLVGKNIVFNIYEIILNNGKIKNCIKYISIDGEDYSIDSGEYDKTIVVGDIFYLYNHLVCFKP